MVKTIKSDYMDDGLGWHDQQQQQQQHQQLSSRQQLHFPMQQQQAQVPVGQQQQLPNFQISFQPNVQPVPGQQPLNTIQCTGNQLYNSGIPLGNSQDYVKKQTGSKVLWAPPKEPSYLVQDATLPPADYYLSYEKLIGHGNESSSVPQGFGTVHQYPQKDNFKGNYCFQMIFPNDSTKLLVTPSVEPGGNKHMYTTNGSLFTVFIAHTAGQSAAVRFLLVYSNDTESTNPVHPCKNHQISSHPKHLLTVIGSGDAKYEETHHPSVLVTPTTTGEIVNGNASCLKYCVQIEFLCRNSCLTRKELTLVCQLEENGVVYGRECLEVKSSACPRRDARVKNKKAAPTPSDTKNLCLPSPRPVKRTADNAFEPQGGAILNLGGDLERFGYLCYMEKRFQQIFPEQHIEAKQQFQSWWAARWNPIEDK